jgi:hypothetical protein
MRVLLVWVLLSATCCGDGLESTSGTWKMNAARSSFAGGAPLKSLTVRIERHLKGEVLTLGRIEADGRTTNYRTVPYLDSERHGDSRISAVPEFNRLGEPTSGRWRLCACARAGDGCASCGASAKSNELVLDITEQSADGQRFDRRLMLEKQ